MCTFWISPIPRPSSEQSYMYIDSKQREMNKCLFWVFRPTRKFSLTWRRHHYRWGAANFDLRSALSSEQWGFWSVLHLLWHGDPIIKVISEDPAAVIWPKYCRYGAKHYIIINQSIRGPVTLTPVVERLAGELPLPVFTTSVYRGWDLNTQTSACGENALTNCASAAVLMIVRDLFM